MSILEPTKKVNARKYLHIIACGLSTAAAAMIQNIWFLAVIVALGLIPVIYLVFKRDFFSIEGKKSMGIIYFPLAFLILILIFAHRPDRWLIVGPMGFLTLSDAFATLVGLKYGQTFFSITGEKKSIIGSIAFILVGFIWMLMMRQMGFQTTEPIGQYLLFSLFISIMAAGFEIMGSGGRDNLYVPFSSAFMFWAYSLAPVRLDPVYLLCIGLVLTAAAFVAWKLKLLNISGALVALIMGVVIICFGHFSIWPMLLFFISGSLLGRLPGRKSSDPKDGKPRDYVQVLSNGGVALLLAYTNCVINHPLMLDLYLITVAVCTADTWSSEIGQRLSKRAFDLRRFKMVPAGLSGCISLPGLLASVGGAAVIALFAPSVEKAILIGSFGLAGSLMDSVVGAFFQARYAKANTQDYSDAGSGSPAAGYALVSNDLVNLISNISVTGLAVLVVFG